MPFAAAYSDDVRTARAPRVLDPTCSLCMSCRGDGWIAAHDLLGWDLGTLGSS